MTYIISSSPPRITCGTCAHTSYHPMDVLNRYCAFCHVFHDTPRPARQDRDFPDNAVYVKLSHNMNVTDKQRIEALTQRDSTIAACMETYRRGGMSYELMLEGLVVLLHQQKEAAIAYAVDANNRNLVPFHLDAGDGQPDKPL